MITRLLQSTAAAALCAATVWAATVCAGVPVRAATLYACLSGCQYTTISAAIAAARSGDTVVVGAGRYREHVTVSHKNVTILGPTIPNTPRGGATIAVLDGGGTGRPLTVTGLYHTDGTPDTNVVVHRLTLTGGRTSDIGGGGAVLAAALTLVDSIVAYNQSSGIGGGLYTNGGAITLLRTLVDGNVNNSSDPNLIFGGGGGIAAVAGASVEATDSIISNNATTADGGGLLATQARLVLTNTVLIGNHAGGSGGGADASQGSIVLRRDLLLANVAAKDGGGLYVGGTTLPLGGSGFVANRPDNCDKLATCQY